MMRAAVLHGARDLRIEELIDPTPGEGEVLVEVAVCGICGSDLHMYQHGGSPVGPEPFGHEFAGTVIAVGPNVDVSRLPVGTRVCVNPIYSCGTCSRCVRGLAHLCVGLRFHGCFAGKGGGMAQRTVVRADMALALPDTMSFTAGALVEPLAVAHHAVGLAGTAAGERAAVVGAGPIGIATAFALRARGVEHIVVVERSAIRRAAATRLGFEAVDPETTQTAGLGADVAFDCAGHPTALELAIGALGPRATLMVVAVYHGTLPVPAMALMGSERRVLSSLAYAPGTFERVIDLIEAGTYPTTGWVDHIALEDVVADGFAALEAGARLKVLVDLT